MSRVQWVRSLTRPSVTCDKATPYLPLGCQESSGVPAFLSTTSGHFLLLFLLTKKPALVIFIKWYGNMRVKLGQSNHYNYSKWNCSLFFFFRSRYCMEFKTESLDSSLCHGNRPWPDGCSISERATQCAWIVNLQLWTLWAFVVLVMAWTTVRETGWRISLGPHLGRYVLFMLCTADQYSILGESQ